MKINDIIEVKIIGIDHYGRGIGKIDNSVIFIPYALENEMVTVKITNIKRNI